MIKRGLALSGPSAVEVAFGSQLVLRAIRSAWADILLCATNTAGEQYAQALADRDIAMEARCLETIRQCADLGVYCANPGEDFPFHVRIGLVQMRRSDVIGLRATYEVMIQHSFEGVSWDIFLSYARDLLRLYVENAAGRRFADVALRAAASGQYLSPEEVELSIHGSVAHLEDNPERASTTTGTGQTAHVGR